LGWRRALAVALCGGGHRRLAFAHMRGDLRDELTQFRTAVETCQLRLQGLRRRDARDPLQHLDKR